MNQTGLLGKQQIKQHAPNLLRAEVDDTRGQLRNLDNPIVVLQFSFFYWMPTPIWVRGGFLELKHLSTRLHVKAPNTGTQLTVIQAR